MARAGSVALEPAFILHARAWQETSQILEVLTQGHGRIGLLARGIRAPRSRLRGVLRPFQPLRLSWAGRGALPTLTGAEAASHLALPAGPALLSMFYLNELLLNFLSRGDPHPDLFAHYADALAALGRGGPAELPLRIFELALLEEVGYGPNLTRDVQGDCPVVAEGLYEYFPERGPVAIDADAAAGKLVFCGAELLGMARAEWQREAVLRAAKRLLRAVLDHHLGGRPLRTRGVVASMRRPQSA